MTVLLADEIKKLCEHKTAPLIHPFNPSQLRPASYQLTLGPEANVGGEHKLIDEGDGIVLDPHQVAVVCTNETLQTPRDVIARWSLRVTNIYEGLLWTGGPQVDPGWEGPLYCPIYNLAERTIVLKRGDPLFTIDFVRTTGVNAELEALRENPDYAEVWFTPKRRTLQEHDRHRLRSAPYQALRELKELSSFRNLGYAAISLMFLVLTFMVAALAVVAVEPTVEPDGPLLSFWPMTALVFSIGSLVFSIGAIVYIYKVSKRL